MTTPQAEIEDLIARIAMGDRAAFRSLYDRTAAKLFGVCLRVLNDRALAEEALQDVYCKIWARAGQYRVNGFSPMTWLITLARNAAIDRRRKRDAGERRKQDPIDAVGFEQSLDQEPVGFHIEGPGIDDAESIEILLSPLTIDADVGVQSGLMGAMSA